MGETGPLFVLEVEGGGHASPDALRLEGGKRLEPVSIGARGQWALSGMGVRDVHGYVAFDGEHLYVQSASPLYPLRVDGAPIGDRWQAVAPPARIAVGGVTLAYLAVTDEGGAPETQRRPQAQDDEATRYDPVEVQPPHERAPTQIDASMYAADDQDATRPGAPLVEVDPDRTRVAVEPPVASPTDPAPPMVPEYGQPPPLPVIPRDRAPGPILDLPPLAPPPAPQAQRPQVRKVLEQLPAQFVAQWREVSLPKKAALVLMPFAFLAVFVLFDDKSAAQRAPSSPSATASAAASAARTTQPIPPASAPPAAEPPPAAPIAARPVAPAPIAQPAGGKSLERMAVDAVVAGAYANAVRRYDELARAHPDQPAFREAARILRARLDAGAP